MTREPACLQMKMNYHKVPLPEASLMRLAIHFFDFSIHHHFDHNLLHFFKEFLILCIQALQVGEGDATLTALVDLQMAK